MHREEPHFNWWALYEQFSTELCEIVRIEYAHYRNQYARLIHKKFPKAVCPEYSVNPGRYGEEVWIGFLKGCYDSALDPKVALVFFRTHYAHAMPWPDGLLRSMLKNSFRMEGSSRSGSMAYLAQLVEMKDNAVRRNWIKNHHAAPINPDAPAPEERLAYRILFEEYDEIMRNRQETALGLYGLLNRGKLVCVERNLKGFLMYFFSSQCPRAMDI